MSLFTAASVNQFNVNDINITGTSKINGALVGNVQVLQGSHTGPVAVDLNSVVSEYRSTAPVDALTLADGIRGQIKYIVYVFQESPGDTGVLTPATPLGFTNITFVNVGDSVQLLYTSAGWAVVGSHGAIILA